MSGESKKIVIGTGNILNVNKKAGQKAAEELFDCLKLTFLDPVIDLKNGKISRNKDDLLAKVTEYERNDIKIGAKIFLNKSCPSLLHDAIDCLLDELQVDNLDNVILVYHPFKSDDSIHTPNGNDASLSTSPLSSSLPKENPFTWGGTAENALDDLKRLWKTLEIYAEEKKIGQLGVADLDTDTLIDLYSTCVVKPTIAQINLSACCVVPPSLQEFCAKNEIQLLTHSDSEVIVSKKTFDNLGKEVLQAFTPTWTSRYQVHIKCRGVLTAKGFIVGAESE